MEDSHEWTARFGARIKNIAVTARWHRRNNGFSNAADGPPAPTVRFMLQPPPFISLAGSPMRKDRYDLELTTDSDTARDHFIAGSDGIMAATPDAEDHLAAAIEADPSFALPHTAVARQHQLMGRVPDARAAADHATELATKATARERQHVEIFRLMVNGKGPDALALTREHVASHPLDAFALAPSCGVFGLIGFSGRQNREPEQLALLEPLVEVYGEDWWFDSAYAFALLEMGRWEEARTRIERSLGHFPKNAHAAHIRAHALYEAGEDTTSQAYLEQWLSSYPPEGLLHCHLWWHLCLMRLVAGDVDGMWSGYDEHCAPDVSTSPSINIGSDGAALLWRAELAGLPQSTKRWQRLTEYCETTFPKPIVFMDFHGSLPYAALGDREGLAGHCERVEKQAEIGRLPAGDLGARLGRGCGAYAQGDWQGTINTLTPLLGETVRIGGSRAQRDLISLTLMSAYVKDGRVDEAQALAGAAHDRQPSTPVAGLDAA